MGFVQFFIDYKWVLLFYLTVIFVIVALRRKIEWQVFGIGLYRTKAGLKTMDSWGKKYKGFFQIIGYIGIGIAFIGMLFIVTNLVYGLYHLMVDPNAQAVISPVIPGFSVPGTELKVPLIIGWIALFIVVVIHEFMHGVICRANDVPVKSSGIAIFGPIGGAFVEPDEKALTKKDVTVQYAMFAAGPFSNIVTGLSFFVISGFLVIPLLLYMTVPTGVEVASVTPNYPAANASIAQGTVVTSVNGVTVTTYDEFSKQLDVVKPGDAVSMKTDKGDYTVITMQNPTDAASTKGFLGLSLKPRRDPKVSGVLFNGLLISLTWFKELLYWLFLLSLGLGLANLLPLGPVDGGRMLQLSCRQITGDKKRGDWWWKKISIATLILLIILLVIPIFKAMV